MLSVANFFCQTIETAFPTLTPSNMMPPRTPQEAFTHEPEQMHVQPPWRGTTPKSLGRLAVVGVTEQDWRWGRGQVVFSIPHGLHGEWIPRGSFGRSPSSFQATHPHATSTL